MKTLLRIDASLRVEGSHTYQLTEYFTDRWLAENPEGEVIQRCLSEQPIPHLTQQGFNAFAQSTKDNDASKLSDQLIQELLMADVLVIGSPLYNLSVPSTLKAYFDHVIRSEKTFKYTDTGCEGLLKDKAAVVITARGGLVDANIQDDFQVDYLPNLLGFLGFNKVTSYCLDGTALSKQELEPRISKIRKQIDGCFEQPIYPEWKGTFSDQDKAEIAALRKGQADAILSSNAKGYTELCAPDIRLMLPGHPAIIGKEAFLSTEQAVFKKATFTRFEKYPLLVECLGDLAYETGVQEVEVANGSGEGGIYASNQKYIHIFRRTEQGWRFAVLTSNSNE